MKAESAIWKVCVAALFAANCTYESTNLGGVLCDNAGEVEAGRRCVDGVWVAVDMSSVPGDMPDPLDMPTIDMVLPDMVEDMPCVPETDGALCMSAQASCGELMVTDRCGVAREVRCGGCMGDDMCGGGGEPNKCGCPCKIDGECFEPGDANPDNGCEVCDPMGSRTGWTAKGAGEACEDGRFCTVGEQCDGQGVCAGGRARDCSGAATNTCEQGRCDEAIKMCAIGFKQAGATCTLSGQTPACVSGACDGMGACEPEIDGESCLISGACHAQLALNPANPCQWCVPTTSATGWTNRGDGASCGAATPCGPRLCNAQTQCVITRASGCIISNMCVPEGATNMAQNRFCDACAGGSNATGWSVAPNTCRINNVCVMAGARNPANECQECNPQFPTQWSNATNGTACTADDKRCTRDVCQSGSCVHENAFIGDNCAPLAGDTCTGTGSACRCDNMGLCVNR